MESKVTGVPWGLLAYVTAMDLQGLWPRGIPSPVTWFQKETILQVLSFGLVLMLGLLFAYDLLIIL